MGEFTWVPHVDDAGKRCSDCWQYLPWEASAEEVTLADVIRALDGPIAPVPCLSTTAYRRCEECKSERTCGVRWVLRDLDDATRTVLEGTTLADLVKRTHDAAPATINYSI